MQHRPVKWFERSPAGLWHQPATTLPKISRHESGPFPSWQSVGGHCAWSSADEHGLSSASWPQYQRMAQGIQNSVVNMHA